MIAFVRMESNLKSGNRRQAMQIGRAGIEAFRKVNDAWGLSAMLYHMGWGLRQFGRYADAIPVLEEATDVAQSAGLYNTAQWALADKGIALLYLGEVDAAGEAFERAQAASEEVGDAAGEVLASYGFGLSARINGDWQRAREQFDIAVPGFDRLGTPVRSGLAMAGLESDHHVNDRPRNAPVRTAVGVAAMTFYGVLWAEGANDVIASKLQIPLYTITWIARVLVFAGPALAYVITKRICLGLQRKDREELLHGYESGIVGNCPAASSSKSTSR